MITTYHESSGCANFIFIRHSLKEAQELFTSLRREGILVRYFAKPRIDQYLRVSIGTDEEMHAFMNTIRQLLNE